MKVYSLSQYELPFGLACGARYRMMQVYIQKSLTLSFVHNSVRDVNHHYAVPPFLPCHSILRYSQTGPLLMADNGAFRIVLRSLRAGIQICWAEILSEPSPMLYGDSTGNLVSLSDASHILLDSSSYSFLLFFIPLPATCAHHFFSKPDFHLWWCQ